MELHKTSKFLKDLTQNNGSSRSCISKINSTLIGKSDKLDIIKPIYNLLEYRQN